VEKLLAAGLDAPDRKVELRVSGASCAYGFWSRLETRGCRRFWDIRNRTDHSEFVVLTAAEISWTQEPDGGKRSLRVEFPDDASLRVAKLSEGAPLVAKLGWFSDGEVRGAFTAAALPFMVRENGHLMLNGRILTWEDENWHTPGVEAVYWRNREIHPDDFWPRSRLHNHVYDALATIQQHSRAWWGLVDEAQIPQSLQQEPRRWREAAESFVRRFGRPLAERLLGQAELDSVMGETVADALGRLVAEPDPRQLTMTFSE
jgi:hypothetical protein